MRGMDEIAADNISKTNEFQEKFVDKVDPFGTSKKKVVIKTQKIKFAAPDA